VLLILVDWAYIVVSAIEKGNPESEVGALRFLRSSRQLETLRLLALIRLDRVSPMFARMYYVVISETGQVVLRISFSILVILAFAHIIACLWFFVGSLDGLPETWVKSNGFDRESLSYCYLSSLHWALTQITTTSMDINPVNESERLFTIIVNISGLIFFSTFLSSITSQMTQLRDLRSETVKQTSLLRRYFHENKISLELSKRVTDFIDEKKLFDKKRVLESELTFLEELPARLLKELRYDIYAPRIQAHPFLARLLHVERGRLGKVICQRGITQQVLFGHEDLFRTGVRASSMYFLVSGVMTYHHWGCHHCIQSGEWVAEPALWIPEWAHRGCLKADSLSEVVGLSCSEFLLAIAPAASEVFVKAYAAAFVRAGEWGDASLFFTDLWGSFADISVLTHGACDEAGMPHEVAAPRRPLSRFSDA